MDNCFIIIATTFLKESWTTYSTLELYSLNLIICSISQDTINYCMHNAHDTVVDAAEYIMYMHVPTSMLVRTELKLHAMYMWLTTMTC